MLFASASFIFLFLPLSLAAFYLSPKQHRKQILLLISVAFYILANLSSPLSIAIMVAAVTATYFAGLVAAGERGSLFAAAGTGVALFLLVTLRIIGQFTESSFFPLGAAIWLLSCVSYLRDIARGDAQPGRPWDTFLYLTYFPVMIVGPIVRYKDFLRCLDRAEYNVNCVADGMRMFAVGFIERMAVAAVFLDAYRKIIGTDGGSLNLVLVLCAGAMIFVISFFAFAGWSDMACGLSMMFGLRLRSDFGDALLSCTPATYFDRIFVGLRDWYRDYISGPLEARFGRTDTVQANPSHTVHRFNISQGLLKYLLRSLFVVWLAVWLKCSLPMLIVGISCGALVFVLDITGIEKMIIKRRWLWPVGWLVTFIAVSVFWTGGVVDSPAQLGQLLGSVAVHSPDFNIYYIYIEMSGGKYIASALVALLTVPLYRRYSMVAAALPRGLRGVYDAVCTVLILAMFAFALLFYLPQYPEYAVEAFKYFKF